MKTLERVPINFPVGYHVFDPEATLQLSAKPLEPRATCRTRQWLPLARGYPTSETWTSEMRSLADEAFARDALVEAAVLHHRAAEFYTVPHGEREVLYERFSALFYQVFAAEGIETHRIPYEGSAFAPATAAEGSGPSAAGHGSASRRFRLLCRGVLLDDALLRGQRLRRDRVRRSRTGRDAEKIWSRLRLPLEKPTGAVLDYFQADDITLVGHRRSAGLRAAVYEKRIRRVIANGHAYHQYKIPLPIAQWLMTFFNTRYKDASNRIALKNITKGGMEGWQMSNLMYITKIEAPMSAFDYAMRLNQANLHCELVDQDVLLMTSREDHFIPYKLHNRQVALLSNTRSLTDRVFTREESAQNHCQIGNVGLALETMATWIRTTTDPGRTSVKRDTLVSP